MKKFLPIAVFLIVSCTAFSQVGIGNTDPKASLDVSATNMATPGNTDGLLIPRIDEFPVTNPTIDQDGMMVFVTGSGTPTKGFYYWDNTGTSWVLFTASTDTDWTEVGANIERQSGDVYIGDTNATNNDLYISDRLVDWDDTTFYLDPENRSRLGEIQINNGTSSTPSLYFSTDPTTGIAGGTNVIRMVTAGSGKHAFTAQGQLEFFHKQSVLIGFNAGNSLTGTFNNSVFVGNGAGESVTSGLGNNAIGFGALDDATTGGNNNIVGQYAASSISTGASNVAFGGSSLIDLTTGSNNVAIGSAAGNADVVSNNNTYLGYQAGAGVPANAFNRTGNVFLGYTAGYAQDVNNRLYIENSTSTTPLIYGEFDTDKVRINGDLEVGDPSGTGYAFPATDGTIGQVMTTDGSGNMTFTNASVNTDNQQIDVLSLTGGNTLNISLQNDGITTQTLDLSAIAGDDDWTDVGADIERQTGDVYIGNTNATDNDLYVSDRIIDWDNTSYYLDPDNISVMDEIQFDNGFASDPSIRFSDASTGFYSPSFGITSYAGGSQERFRIQADGEIQYRTTVATSYDFTTSNLFGNAGINIGSSLSNLPLFNGYIANDSRDNILRLDIQSINTNFDHSTLYATNNIGNTSVRLAYNDGSATGRYAVYADGGTGYAGYFLGDLTVGTNTANTYTFPTSRGTNNQIMQTNATGIVSWADPATPNWTDGGTFLYPTDGTSEDVVIGQNTSGTGRLSITTGNKTAGVTTTKSGNFSGLHYGINNYLSNSGGGASVGVNNLIEGTGGSNLRFGTRTVMNGSSTPTAVSHYGSYNEINTTGTGFRYGTYNLIAATAGGTHYGSYNSVDPATGWAGYFVGKSYVSDKLGVGETNPDGFLQVNADNTGTNPNIKVVDIGSSGARIQFTNTGTTNGNEFTFFGDTDNTTANSRFNLFHTGTGNILRVTGDGKLGIMRTPSTNTFEVNGQASKATAGDWIANSDRRLKKNIETIDSKSALERITSLRGVTYEWNDNQTGNNRPKGIQYGFIAQELMEVFPEHVTKDTQGFYQTAYGTYDALYVQAFKEQQVQIDNLSEENKKLKEQLAKYASLEARLSALENGKTPLSEEIVSIEKK